MLPSKIPVKDLKFDSNLYLKSSSPNKSRLIKLKSLNDKFPSLKNKLSIIVSQNDNEEGLKSPPKSSKHEIKEKKQYFQSHSKFLKEESKPLKSKLKELRSFNLLIANEKSYSSYTSSPISTRVQLNNLDNSCFSNKKREECQEIVKKSKPDIREYPARYMSPTNMKKLANFHKSCAYINPQLKQDLQIIQDNSSSNIKKTFKEEKLYIKYLLARNQGFKLTEKIVRFDN